MVLVLFEVWEDANIQVHETFLLKISNHLKGCSAVSPEHRVPHPDLRPELLSGCTVGQWLQWLLNALILVELDGGQRSLFYNPLPFGLNFDPGLEAI